MNEIMGSLTHFRSDSIDKKIGDKNGQSARIKRRIVETIKRMRGRDWESKYIDEKLRERIKEITQNIEYLEIIAVQKHILVNKKR